MLIENVIDIQRKKKLYDKFFEVPVVKFKRAKHLKYISRTKSYYFHIKLSYSDNEYFLDTVVPMIATMAFSLSQTE